MRTTVSIDDAVLREAKQRAAAEGRSLSDLVTECLRERIARRPVTRRRRVRLPTDTGNGVQPGVDVTNNASLRDLMDDIE